MIIGIDPDLEKSGWAVIEDGNFISVGTLEFPQIVEVFIQRKGQIKKVYIEAG